MGQLEAVMSQLETAIVKPEAEMGQLEAEKGQFTVGEMIKNQELTSVGIFELCLVPISLHRCLLSVNAS